MRFGAARSAVAHPQSRHAGLGGVAGCRLRRLPCPHLRQPAARGRHLRAEAVRVKSGCRNDGRTREFRSLIDRLILGYVRAEGREEFGRNSGEGGPGTFGGGRGSQVVYAAAVVSVLACPDEYRTASSL